MPVFITCGGNLLFLKVLESTNSGFIPTAMHLSYRHFWQCFLLTTAISHLPSAGQAKSLTDLFWMARRKKALQEKHTTAP